MNSIEDQLALEASNRVISASAKAIRSAIGNLPLPVASVEIFISAESERLGALLHHDVKMFLLRLQHGPDSIPTVWPTTSKQREAIANWRGEPRRQDESISQFRRRVLKETGLE